MTTTIWVIVIAFFLYLQIRYFLIITREKRLNDLSVIYERMVQYIIKSKLDINHNVKSFLHAHKNLVVNPSFLDIEVRFVLILSADERKLRDNKRIFETIYSEMPQELQSYSDQFANKSKKIILYSTFNLTFLSKIFVLFSSKLMAAIWHLSSGIFIDFMKFVFSRTRVYQKTILIDEDYLIHSTI